MKNEENIQTVGTIQKSNIKIVERGKLCLIPNSEANNTHL